MGAERTDAVELLRQEGVEDRHLRLRDRAQVQHTYLVATDIGRPGAVIRSPEAASEAPVSGLYRVRATADDLPRPATAPTR